MLSLCARLGLALDKQSQPGGKHQAPLFLVLIAEAVALAGNGGPVLTGCGHHGSHGNPSGSRKAQWAQCYPVILVQEGDQLAQGGCGRETNTGRMFRGSGPEARLGKGLGSFSFFGGGSQKVLTLLSFLAEEIPKNPRRRL